ncbi:MAG: hypothetical protein ACLU6O_11215 [Bilophila wadsworthia]
MNRAEKTDPLPFCRGFFIRATRKGVLGITMRKYWGVAVGLASKYILIAGITLLICYADIRFGEGVFIRPAFFKLCIVSGGVGMFLFVQLEEANRHADEVEKRAANAEQFVSCRDIDGHGLCSLVIRMRQEGKTDEEIAEFLSSSRRSLSQIGALLHTDPEATQAAQVKLAQRLLGKA